MHIHIVSIDVHTHTHIHYKYIYIYPVTSGVNKKTAIYPVIVSFSIDDFPDHVRGSLQLRPLTLVIAYCSLLWGVCEKMKNYP